MNAAWIGLLTVAFLASMTLLYAATLRVGPRRRHWNQPAAAFQAPGRKLAASLYLFAALHVAAAIWAAIAVDLNGMGVQLALVGVLAGGFYAACGSVAAIAPRIGWVRRVSPHD